MNDLGILSNRTVDTILVIQTDKVYQLWSPELDSERKTHYLLYNEVELTENVYNMVQELQVEYPHLSFYLAVDTICKHKKSVDVANDWFKRLDQEYSLKGEELSELERRSAVVSNRKEEAEVIQLIAPSMKMAYKQRRVMNKKRKSGAVVRVLRKGESATRVGILVPVRIVGNISYGILDTSAKLVNYGFSALEKVIMESKKDIKTIMAEREAKISKAQSDIVKYVSKIPKMPKMIKSKDEKVGPVVVTVSPSAQA